MVRDVQVVERLKEAGLLNDIEAAARNRRILQEQRKHETKSVSKAEILKEDPVGKYDHLIGQILEDLKTMDLTRCEIKNNIPSHCLSGYLKDWQKKGLVPKDYEPAGKRKVTVGRHYQASKTREADREAMIADYKAMKIEEFEAKWHISDLTWKHLKKKWGVPHNGIGCRTTSIFKDKETTMDETRVTIITELENLKNAVTNFAAGIKELDETVRSNQASLNLQQTEMNKKIEALSAAIDTLNNGYVMEDQLKITIVEALIKTGSPEAAKKIIAFIENIGGIS